jgi:hypothetical protein
MKNILFFLMVGFIFTAFHVTSVSAQNGTKCGKADTAWCTNAEIAESQGTAGGNNQDLKYDKQMDSANPGMQGGNSMDPSNSMSGGDTTGHSPVDISHCADMPPTTRPACEAQAHSGPPLNADGTPMAPPADCGGVPCPTGHDGGPDGHHPPADCGGVPCPTGHDGGPDGHHPPADCGGVPCPTGHDGGDGHHDGPPIDPRTISDANPQGTPFTAADEAKYQVYADECETSGGTISPASLAILTGDGFTPEQVNGLCQMSANDGPPPAPPAP